MMGQLLKNFQDHYELLLDKKAAEEFSPGSVTQLSNTAEEGRTGDGHCVG